MAAAPLWPDELSSTYSELSEGAMRSPARVARLAREARAARSLGRDPLGEYEAAARTTPERYAQRSRGAHRHADDPDHVLLDTLADALGPTHRISPLTWQARAAAEATAARPPASPGRELQLGEQRSAGGRPLWDLEALLRDSGEHLRGSGGFSTEALQYYETLKGGGHAQQGSPAVTPPSGGRSGGGQAMAAECDYLEGLLGSILDLQRAFSGAAAAGGGTSAGGGRRPHPARTAAPRGFYCPAQVHQDPC